MRALLATALVFASGCRCEEPPSGRIVQPFPREYAGVGIELGAEGGRPVVVRVIPGSPAAAGGLRPGDRVVAVDGLSTTGWRLAEVVAALRGEAGSHVFVTVRRDGSSEIVALERRRLVRGEMVQGPVDGRLYRPEGRP